MAILSSVKAQVSQLLASFKFSKPEASQFIDRLPVDVSDLPEALPKRANLALVKPRISVSELLMTAQSFNWREARGKQAERYLRHAGHTSNVVPLMMMQGLVQLGQMMTA